MSETLSERLEAVLKATEGHTPGPWILDPDKPNFRVRGPKHRWTGKRRYVAFVAAISCEGEAETVANGELIIGAPELKDIATSLEALVAELRIALEESQQALIGMTGELGVIESQTPGGLPYGIKNPKIAMDLAIVRNAKVLMTIKEGETH